MPSTESKRVVVVDNYDSFTFNLVQYLSELGARIDVFRNDAVSVEEIEGLADGILLSPGPGRPQEAGISMEVIARLAGRIPILGVCLGHQAIAFAFGGVIGRADRIMHGKTSLVHHDGSGVFEGLPTPFSATRYNSLLVRRESLPKELSMTAWTDEGEIMGLRHGEMNLEGIQFHPESVLSEHGHALLGRWLESL